MNGRFILTHQRCVNALGVGILSAWVAAVGTVWAANLYVANDGVDSTTCGSVTNPCRSISKAIYNAGNGDTIIVGPGWYGDVDHSGFAGPGDEAGPNTACNCMIDVDKELTIISSDGASETILDASDSGGDGVLISSSGATLGASKRGFTIIGASGNGVTISNGLDKVAVIGNRADANGSIGFFVSDGTVSNLVGGNISINNADNGFEVHGESNFIEGNAATANTRDGFHLIGTAHLLTGNIATDNGRTGFNVISNSTAILVRNAAIANTRFGIVISSNSTAKIQSNNIFGNNESPVNSFGSNGLLNCGLVNNSFGTLTASGNYYGAKTGPGPDPADIVVNIGTGSTTTNLTISKIEIRITPITP